jgi:lipoic acid synthetase
MLGLGETEMELMECLVNLRNIDCDILTLGQYLSPSKNHFPVVRYIPPGDFLRYREKALEMGFKKVFANPLVRSSYRAEDLL